MSEHLHLCCEVYVPSPGYGHGLRWLYTDLLPLRSSIPPNSGIEDEDLLWINEATSHVMDAVKRRVMVVLVRFRVCSPGGGSDGL